MDFLGSAAFSSAVHCRDLQTNDSVCLKIIKNNKDFFDQSIDEIKLLQFINAAGDPDEYKVVRLHGTFLFHPLHGESFLKNVDLLILFISRCLWSFGLKIFSRYCQDGEKKRIDFSLVVV